MNYARNYEYLLNFVKVMPKILVASFFLVINGDGGCGEWQPYTGGLTAQVDWLGLRVGGHLAPNHIHQMNRVNSRNDFKS